MIDENALGLFIGYHGIEDDEYAGEPADFAGRLLAFHEALIAWLTASPLGEGVQAVDLGHGCYFELAEGDENVNPIEWLRGLRAALGAAGFATVAVLTHGSRWVAEGDEAMELPGVECVRELLVHRLSHSSEPLRKALHAATATEHDPTGPGWGEGLYADAEALEALAKKLKNEPTPLHVAGAVFYRLGA